LVGRSFQISSQCCWFCQVGLTCLMGTGFLVMLCAFLARGQIRVTTSTPPFLYYGFFFLLFFQTRRYRNSMKISGPFLALLIFFFLPCWIHLNLPFHLTISSRKGIHSDSFNSKVVNVHHREESPVLLPWHWVLIVQPCTVLQQLFFLRFKKQRVTKLFVINLK
jgi:hypothetical protein